MTRKPKVADRQAATETQRSSLFISHAVEDNDFAMWLGARLSAAGHGVWADVLRLKGGDDWQRVLEDALRNRAVKMLWVASPYGSTKQGVRNEIQIATDIARKIGDEAFIIPLKLADCDAPFLAVHIQWIDFRKGWGRGLAELLDTLHGVPGLSVATGVNSDSMGRWLAAQSARNAVLDANTTDVLISNWLPFCETPSTLRYFAFSGAGADDMAERAVAGYELPAVKFGTGFLGFGSLDDYRRTPFDIPPRLLQEIPLDDYLRDGVAELQLKPREARNLYSALVRMAVEKFLRDRGLFTYDYSDRKRGYWIGSALLKKFAHGQTSEHPRDGLYLYGPVAAQGTPLSVDYGVIGTVDGISHFKKWAAQVSLVIPRHVPRLNPNALHHITFPGFEAAFNATWPLTPAAQIVLDQKHIEDAILIGNKAEGIKKTVDLFVNALVSFANRNEVAPKFWFVIIPELIYRYGRAKQPVPKTIRLQGQVTVTRRQASKILQEPSLFVDEDSGADVYRYGLDFRRQLKARLLEPRIVTQIVRETTIAPEAFLNAFGNPIRTVEDPATIAWKLCTTAYYKAGGQPWRLANVRPGVCYVGLVFKQTDPEGDETNACCAAQMFLASGDGLVFRGALGPWYTPNKKEFHLTKDAASQLIGTIIESYKEQHEGATPKELFLHGKARFSEDEWRGFQEAAPTGTNVVCVQIRSTRNEIKLFRSGRYPVIRGTLLKTNSRTAYLWTSGYVPRLDTYIGPETPNPMYVSIHWGECNFDSVLSDVMGLTKINLNTCLFNDGRPVTIRFAEAVGDVLVAAPQGRTSPKLPFKFYI